MKSIPDIPVFSRINEERLPYFPREQKMIREMAQEFASEELAQDSIKRERFVVHDCIGTDPQLVATQQRHSLAQR